MSYFHLGTATTLAREPVATIPDGGISYIWLNGYERKMVFHIAATNAQDTTNHPYYVRPDDYSTAGVWIEDVGADQPQAWNAGQIATGILKSLNCTTTTGCAFDLDNELLKIGGSNVNFDLDVTPGIIMGLDSGAYKFSIGKAYGDADSQSFIKWTGAAMAMRLAAGQAFDLYGSMNIYGGGDITLKSDYSTGNVGKLIFSNEYSEGSFYDFLIEPSGVYSKILHLYPETAYIGGLDIGGGPDGSKAFSGINMAANMFTTANTYGSTGSAKRSQLQMYATNTEALAHFHVSQGTGPYYTSALKIRSGTDKDIIINFNSSLAATFKSAGLTLEGGIMCLKETTTPSAVTNYGKIYPKSDNKLYFQDGAGTEHEIAFA